MCEQSFDRDGKQGSVARAACGEKKGDVRRSSKGMYAPSAHTYTGVPSSRASSMDSEDVDSSVSCPLATLGESLLKAAAETPGTSTGRLSPSPCSSPRAASTPGGMGSLTSAPGSTAPFEMTATYSRHMLRGALITVEEADEFDRTAVCRDNGNAARGGHSDVTAHADRMAIQPSSESQSKVRRCVYDAVFAKW